MRTIGDCSSQAVLWGLTIWSKVHFSGALVFASPLFECVICGTNCVVL